MRNTAFLSLLVFIAGPALALEPIPGSITYGGRPPARILKSPIGSSLTHNFSRDGYDYEERYVIMPDRTLRLVSRTRRTGR